MGEMLSDAIISDEKDREKRLRLDELFRELAFKHRDKFPELTPTPFLQAWERMTGQKW